MILFSHTHTSSVPRGILTTNHGIVGVWRDQVHGAETYLFAAFGEEVTFEDAVTGYFVIPDGRWHPGQRKDLLLAIRGTEEGGSGRAGDIHEWCEARARVFV